MRNAPAPRQFATAVRARAVALSRAEVRLFFGTMSLLLALWGVLLLAVGLGLGGQPAGATGPGQVLLACGEALPQEAGPGGRQQAPPLAPRPNGRA